MADQESPSPDLIQYWCYHCEKRVSVETLDNDPDIICLECKNGFVESIIAAAPHTDPSSNQSPSADFVDEPSFGSQFLQVLRLIAQASREDDDAPPPPPPDANSDDGEDFLRIELDAWANEHDRNDEEEFNEIEFENAVEQQEEEEEEEEEGGDGSDNEISHQSDLVIDNGDDDEETDEDEDEDEDGGEDEEDRRRRRRDVVRLRIRDIAARTRSGRNRFLDWADILMGLEDNSIELRLELPQDHHIGYIGNPEDYVDAAGYEALLQNLADSDQSGRRGAPPASKSAIKALDTVVIGSEEECLVCAICKDGVSVGGVVTKLPCGHGYHGDCIVPWLGSRNSCPVCRFELPTEDLEYEEEKKKLRGVDVNGASGSG